MYRLQHRVLDVITAPEEALLVDEYRLRWEKAQQVVLQVQVQELLQATKCLGQ